jgi:hypothetical protein
LTVIGYSFPSGDLTAGQWVSSNFRGWRMDVVDVNSSRPEEIRSRLPEAALGEDATGMGAVTAYVDRECGSLVRWNLKKLQPTDELTAELWIDGVDVLAARPASRKPWKDDYQLAQRWVHERVQAAAPNSDILDRAIGAMSGSFDSRYFVLPKGAKVELD